MRLALLAFTFAWLAACETPHSAPTSQTPLLPPPSFATTIANEKVPVAGSFEFNPCPPEEFVDLVDGFLHFLVTGEVGETFSDVTIHVNGEGIEGVGQVTGARYSVPLNEKDEVTVTAEPFTESEEADLRLRLIREGALENFWLRVTATSTFPPGDVDVKRLEIECRG